MIPVYYIRKYPQFNGSHSWEPHYVLSEVDEEVGHTVVQFLCTGNYETLRTASDPDVSNMAIEYRRSMLVYHAARKYDLYDLEVYAKKYIKIFGESMSTFDRMEAARKIYSTFPKMRFGFPATSMNSFGLFLSSLAYLKVLAGLRDRFLTMLLSKSVGRIW
jgi:hypothetical protein